MTDPARISDMIGLRTEAAEAEAVWPLNVVLLALGGAILGVAFAFLDVADPRPLYNPWTYAIATPVALMGLSALLSTVVSHMVEKSMQLAFLLSVLIHLILLVCATNVVIFSRMWPDVLNALDQQREQLKRERLNAKQYHRTAITKQSGGRPDYLKPAATEHQPTEIELAAAPQLTLARSDRANLISPSPKIELTHSPSLLEREQAATTLPSRRESAASLSRSDLALPQATPSRPQLEYFPLQAAEPAAMSPAPSAVSRKTAASGVGMSPAPALPPDSSRRSATALDRRSNTSAAPTEDSQLPPAFERHSLADLQPSRTPNEITTPEANLSSPETAEISPAPVAAGQRRGASPRSEAVSPTRLPPAPSHAPQVNVLANRSPRRESATLTPAPATSDTSLTLPRSTAGGNLGAAAPSSMPVRGIEDVGLAQPTENASPRIDSIVTSNRRSPARSSMSQLPMVGSLSASSWNGTPSLAGGAAGLSPSQLAQSAEPGRAASEDVAGLAGADRDLDRSALSRAGQPSPTAVRGIETLLSDASAASSTLDFSGENPAALSAAGAVIGRSTTAASALHTTGASPSFNENLPGSSSSLGQSMGATPGAVHPLSLSEESTSASDSRPTGGLPRYDALSSTAPEQSRIGIPDIDANWDASVAPAAETQAAAGAELARRAESGARGSADQRLPANLLAIDATIGPGGIAAAPDLVGPLLSRRDSALDNWSPPQLEAQRFARQDVGGPLAAGQQVALPKPAFQQRIDRLKDRQPQDESSREPQTELAIERGLEFLAKHQRPDGSWRLQDFDTPVLMRSDTAATGLALLAFQGAGYTHNQFKYATTVDKAIQFLVQHQTVSGDLYIPQDPASDQNAWLYSHAIASLALCEAVGMTQDDRLRPAAQKAIDFMVASQDPRRGGWRYRPGVGADTSVTGWFMMAFKSGQLAGLKVPQPTMSALERFLVASQSPEGEPYLYRYNPFAADTPQQRHGLQPTSVMTSVGLLMRLYFGWQRDRDEMMAGGDYLLKHLPEHGSQEASRRDTYYWYYATQVMFHMRGQWWQKWHDRLYPLLINSQITQGELAGSWDPNYPTPDLWARYGGRLYVTTLNLLSLEVSYRHLPLYEATGK